MLLSVRSAHSDAYRARNEKPSAHQNDFAAGRRCGVLHETFFAMLLAFWANEADSTGAWILHQVEVPTCMIANVTNLAVF